MKARLVCPKCGKPLAAAVTRVKDETGKEHRRIHYHCQDRRCDGQVEDPAEYRAFVRPVPQLTSLRRWLGEHHRRAWTPYPQHSPALGGGFAALGTRSTR